MQLHCVRLPVKVAFVPKGMLKLHMMEQAKLHHVVANPYCMICIQCDFSLYHPADGLFSNKTLVIGSKVIFPAEKRMAQVLKLKRKKSVKQSKHKLDLSRIGREVFISSARLRRSPCVSS